MPHISAQSNEKLSSSQSLEGYSIFSLEDKVAVVTGALGLLGKHHCHALPGAGANVAVADLDDTSCGNFAAELEETYQRDAFGSTIDITRRESVDSFCGRLMEKFGHIDVLVNNAAINDMFENPLAAIETVKIRELPSRTLAEIDRRKRDRDFFVLAGHRICHGTTGTREHH